MPGKLFLNHFWYSGLSATPRGPSPSSESKSQPTSSSSPCSWLSLLAGWETNEKRGMNALPFTDQQIALLRELAAPLAPSQRSAFLEDVARRLNGVEPLGDGTVAQAAREAQAAIRKASPWLQA